MAWWTLVVPTACWQQLIFLFILIFLVIPALLEGSEELWKLVLVASLSSLHFDPLSHESG